MSSRTERTLRMRWLAALVATLATAAVLRFVGLGSQLWYDEIYTLVTSARLPLGQIITAFPGVNTHPFYSVLAHLSMSAFGEAAWSLRLPACLFGIASVWMVYVLGSRLATPIEALAGALVLATSYHHIWFSQNARGYTMLGFFTLASTYFLLQAWQGGRRRDYVLYSLACAAGVYTHLTMVLVVAGHGVVVLLDRAVSRRPVDKPLGPMMWSLSGAALLSAIAYAPFIPALVAHLGVEAPREAAKVATAGWAASEAVRSLMSGPGVLAALAGGLVALIGALSLSRGAPMAVALLVVPAFVTGGVIVLLGQPVRPRFFFFMSGAVAIFAGRGIGAIAGALTDRHGREAPAMPVGPVVVGTLLLVALSALGLPRNYRVPKQDFEGAVRFLDGEASSGAHVAAAGPACFPIERFYGRAGWPCLLSVADLRGLKTAPGRVLVVHSLGDYIEDPALRDEIRLSCAEVRRFAGTLGGGDVVVCDPRGMGRP